MDIIKLNDKSIIAENGIHKRHGVYIITRNSSCTSNQLGTYRVGPSVLLCFHFPKRQMVVPLVSYRKKFPLCHVSMRYMQC
jgi:hypothetical protein